MFYEYRWEKYDIQLFTTIQNYLLIDTKDTRYLNTKLFEAYIYDFYTYTKHIIFIYERSAWNLVID